MRFANTLTGVRLVLSPVFFVAFFWSAWTGRAALFSVVLAVLCFVLIEVSDLLDGQIARRTGTVTDVGKLLDPLADSLSRLTYFVCFAAIGIMPVWVLLLVIYRDVGVAYLRVLAQRSGTTMGARFTGKLKAWIYGFAGFAGILRSLDLRGLISAVPSVILSTVSAAAFLACAGIAVGSLVDYLIPVLASHASQD